MTEEEILRKKLDWLNQNSHYGIMTDNDMFDHISMIMNVDQAEIAKIVHYYIERGISCDYDRLNCPKPPIYIGSIKIKTLKERLEEIKMKKATSVQNIKNVNDVSFLLADDPIEMGSKLIIVASTNDDIFKFEFEGGLDLLQSCKAAGLFTGWEKDQKIRELEKELGEWKKEASNCLRLRDEVRREKNKEINNLKQQLQQAEDDKERLTWKNEQLEQENKTKCENCLAGAGYEEMYRNLRDKIEKENEQLKETIKKLEHDDMLDKNAADYWSKEHDILLERFAKLQVENEKLKDKVEHVEPFRALEQTIREKQQLTEENENLKKHIKRHADNCRTIAQRNNELREELALEKAANEAQHKFIREYAGKDTEVQFNYAIDETGESSYVIVDKEEYNKNFEKWANAQVENAPASTSRADILDQAKKCVCGQREQDYGTPESNFQLIADLWNGYLGEKVTPVDVSMMMALMKIARIRNGGGSGDSFVDLAGYAACGGEIWHGQKVKDQN